MICLKLLKNIFLSFLFIFCLTNFAQAKCNFGINIGENISKLKNELADEYVQGSLLTDIDSLAIEFCPNENFDENISVNFTFVGSELASIRLIAWNNKENITSNKLLLMNYAKQNYGDFDTGQNPKVFNYFKVWNDGIKLIVYKRMLNHLQIYEEEIYITNNIYQLKLDEVNALLELKKLKGKN
tara:strand:- start:670 stop:1221 length:552 start_codon:yes stop_codon:yes gene_type:complete